MVVHGVGPPGVIFSKSRSARISQLPGSTWTGFSKSLATGCKADFSPLPIVEADGGSGPGPTLSVMFAEAGYDIAIYDPYV